MRAKSIIIMIGDLFLVAGMSACSSAGSLDTSANSGTIARVTAPLSTLPGKDDSTLGRGAELHSVTDVFPFDQGTWDSFWNVKANLIRNCMQEKGFNFDPKKGERPTKVAEIYQLLGPTLAEAEENGYAVGGSADDTSSTDLSVVSQEADLALADENGVGCLSAAEHAIFSTRVGSTSLDIYRQLTAESDSAILVRLDQSPAFLEVLKAWSKCMHDRGYPYSNPGEGIMAIGGPNTAGSKVQIQLAVADVGCRQDVGWKPVVTEEYSKLVDDYLTGKEGIIVQMREAAELDLKAIKEAAS